jgi:O-succinylbenzoic acid--CoA ligase
LDDPLAASARRRPEALALRAEGADLTYAQLDALAAGTVARLADSRVGRGDRVATTLPPGVAFAALLHALPRLGAALVPVNTRLTSAERSALLEQAAPRLVIEEPVDAEPLVAGAGDPPPPLDPDAPHAVLFTSGTTAAPKPVALTYANHRASAMASAENLGVEPDDRWLCVLPLFHVGGLAILLRSALYGTAAVVHERFDVSSALRSLGGGEATLVSLVPTQLHRLREAGLGETIGAPALRAALLGGGPVPRELIEWAAERGLPVLQTYGMTETASQIATLPAAEAARKGGSAGRPLTGVELRIADPDGEILVRGPMVAKGELAGDGWLHTGDRGRVDEDGFLWVEGRLKDVIVTAGENVSAAEVEAALAEHPSVAEAAVVGAPDAEWGERVVAYVVLSGPADGAELVAHCRERLAGYKAPREVRVLADLPRTASGKVRREALSRALR